MEYLKFTFSVEPIVPGNEILIAYLGEKGFESFIENEKGFEAFISKPDFFEAMLPSPDEFQEIIFSFQNELIPHNNWNAEWEKNFTPVYVEDKVCIRAPFHEVPEARVIDLIITPKMSFGTGHHDTTWLMCRKIFGMDLNGKSVLDMGCGTGVLAILAKKKGASRVLAIDIDKWSIENSAENCEVNAVKDIEVIKGDSRLLSSEKFDLIVANINRNVLTADIPVYASVLKSNGKILLSGFFETDFTKLISVAEMQKLDLVSTEVRNTWGLIELEKKI